MKYAIKGKFGTISRHHTIKSALTALYRTPKRDFSGRYIVETKNDCILNEDNEEYNRCLRELLSVGKDTNHKQRGRK